MSDRGSLECRAASHERNLSECSSSSFFCVFFRRWPWSTPQRRENSATCALSDQTIHLNEPILRSCVEGFCVFIETRRSGTWYFSSPTTQSPVFYRAYLERILKSKVVNVWESKMRTGCGTLMAVINGDRRKYDRKRAQLRLFDLQMRLFGSSYATIRREECNHPVTIR